MTSRQPLSNANGRIAIVDGLRTPFARIATHFRDHSAIDLGALAVGELMARNGLGRRDIDQLIYGMTVMIPEAPFIAREVALQLGLDDVDAYSITRACATSFQTVASAAEGILAGSAEVVIAGGTDSTSSVRLPMSPKFSSTLRDVSFAKTAGARLKLLASLRPGDLLPQQPSITEFSVGETMGESTEKMVKKWGVSRAEQDDLAHASHSHAARAWREGRLDRQVMSVDLPAGTLKTDNLVRMNSERHAREVLGRQHAVGEVDRDKLNVNGGSLAYGHPFGATGGRVILQALYELRRRGGGTALTTACAAGGVGAAMVLESE